MALYPQMTQPYVYVLTHNDAVVCVSLRQEFVEEERDRIMAALSGRGPWRPALVDPSGDNWMWIGPCSAFLRCQKILLNQ